MQTSVTFKNLDPSDNLKSYVWDKLDRFDKYLDNPAEATVVLTVKKFRHISIQQLFGNLKFARNFLVTDIFGMLHQQLLFFAIGAGRSDYRVIVIEVEHELVAKPVDDKVLLKRGNIGGCRIEPEIYAEKRRIGAKVVLVLEQGRV